jgi:hypothetical protein
MKACYVQGLGKACTSIRPLTALFNLSSCFSLKTQISECPLAHCTLILCHTVCQEEEWLSLSLEATNSSVCLHYCAPARLLLFCCGWCGLVLLCSITKLCSVLPKLQPKKKRWQHNPSLLTSLFFRFQIPITQCEWTEVTCEWNGFMFVLQMPPGGQMWPWS